MAILDARRIAQGLSERFASAWVLLSDTDDFLSRTSVFHQYEAELKRLRADLSAALRDPDRQSDVRDRIVRLRKHLRLQGYDLSLHGYDLVLRGYRNDAAFSEGFRRLVILADSRKVCALAGEDNHVTLYGFLEAQAGRAGLRPEATPHFLWYRWTRKLLELSGSDSEPASNFEELKAYCSVPENRMKIISALKCYA